MCVLGKKVKGGEGGGVAKGESKVQERARQWESKWTPRGKRMTRKIGWGAGVEGPLRME